MLHITLRAFIAHAELLAFNPLTFHAVALRCVSELSAARHAQRVAAAAAQPEQVPFRVDARRENSGRPAAHAVGRVAFVRVPAGVKGGLWGGV